MPTIEVNDAQLQYEVFGTPAASATPILLIHGSALTGQADWGEIAPLLALKYRVILPDCLQRNRERRSLRVWSAACSIGAEKLGQPVPLLNLASEANSGWPQPAQW